MRRVIIESPFRPIEEAPTSYVRRAMRDALDRGDAPLASHLVYPGVLDDSKPEERALGIEAGLRWGEAAIETIAYVDYGVSIGMAMGVARAVAEGRPVILRALDRPEAVGAFEGILRLTRPTDDNVFDLRKQITHYQVALEAEKVERRKLEAELERHRAASNEFPKEAFG